MSLVCDKCGEVGQHLPFCPKESAPAEPVGWTARTDAVWSETGQKSFHELLDLARQLERELWAHAEHAKVYRAEAEKAEHALAEMAKYVDEAARRSDKAEREVAGLRADAESWKSEAEMIANAWQRELCDQGIIYRPKTHWIDFMVIATQKVMALAKENGVACCGYPELCTNMNCNTLLRYRLAALKEPKND